MPIKRIRFAMGITSGLPVDMATVGIMAMAMAVATPVDKVDTVDEMDTADDGDTVDNGDTVDEVDIVDDGDTKLRRHILRVSS